MGRASLSDDDEQLAENILDFVDKHPFTLEEVAAHHDITLAALADAKSE